MLRDKKEQQKYEDKLVELNGAVNKKAHELSEITGQVEQAKSDLVARQKDVRDAGVKLDGIMQQIADLERDHAGKKKLFDEAAESYPKELARLSDLAKEYQRQALLAGKEATLAQNRLNRLMKLIEAANDEYDVAERNLKQLNGDVEKAKKIIKKAEEAQRRIDEERAVVREERKKNSAILTKSELNLRTLEVYAKRLQRYYNQSGIKINVLREFNIKVDK